MTTYMLPLRRWNTLAKELTVATREMQSRFNELSISLSDSVTCKQTEVNTCTLNSLDCVGSADGFYAITENY